MEESNEFKLGQIVLASAGRDRGRALLIVKIVDHLYVHVADGDLRRLSKPKVKKVKHLRKTHFVSDKLARALMDGQQISDSDVRNELKLFTSRTE